MGTIRVLKSLLTTASVRKDTTLLSVFLVVVFLLCTSVVRSQGLTATLQKGNNMTAFYGITAFKDAVAAADDEGNVITLSEGTFNTGTSSVPMEISKSITIIGNGGTTLSAKTSLGYLNITGSKVRVESVYIDVVSLGEVTDVAFFRSYINRIESTAVHINTLIDQCEVDYDYAIQNGKNYCIKNSVINRLSYANSPLDLAYIENCIIFSFMSSRGNPTVSGPSAIYKNNIILIKETYGIILSNPSQAFNNIFIRPSSCCSLDIMKNNKFGITQKQIFGDERSFSYSMDSMKVVDDTYTGEDGTPVGIFGGTGCSTIPTNPQITEKVIDSHTDKDGKINVKITVKAQP